jgi:polynucleotide 5'-hydroxyl-kinase GRC3/NOL9
VKISPGERVVVLGEYGLQVVVGRVTVLGATLKVGEDIHHIHAFSSHSIPVIRYLESPTEVVLIRLWPFDRELQSLKRVSPLFARMSNDLPTVLGFEDQSNAPSPFQILFSNMDAPPKMVIQNITSPPEWNETFAAAASGKWSRGNASITMVCGPKGSGKSTFSKLLLNRLITQINMPPRVGQAITRNNKKFPGVLLLDIDPGQPEYSPPGQLSLVHVTKPNLGPPFTHPAGVKHSFKVIRAHSICAITPSQDPEHYSACVNDMLTHYRKFAASNPDCPLIINTPGWVLGTGLELLTELIRQAKPTVVMYMSVEGPAEVVQALGQEAASVKAQVVTLPSQGIEFAPRSAAQLRIMQTMSYFHLTSSAKDDTPMWNGSPLSSIAPWVVRYGGENAGISGIMCIGEQPPSELLAEAINGTLVAVVVLDDLEAVGISDKGNWQSKHFFANMVTETEEEGLPYMSTDKLSYLDPRHSHTIGMALIRGIDVERKRLHLLTPIDSGVVKELKVYGKRIVLVSGKLETPGWAYTEELHNQASASQDVEKRVDENDEADGNGMGDITEEAPEGFDSAPWIERIEGHQGRGIGARVWKVRRDLGRSTG